MHGRDISLSIQTFEKLIDGKRIYVDKTQELYKLITSSATAYFLSRPRRFGKSLTISTLDAIFPGKKNLFENLAITNTDYAWPIHPVIRLDMKYAAEADIIQAEKGLKSALRGMAEKESIYLGDETVSKLFEMLIQNLYLKTGQKVVILIDEYDKPLIDNLDNMEEARKIQGMLKRFYGVLKSADEYLRFVFITGVSKFTKVSVFSDLNHLTDLTFNPSYATLVGMTEEELVQYYLPYIQDIAKDKSWTQTQVLEQIRYWYNGYQFSKQNIRVYNPWSTLSLFNTGDFQEHWYTTGIPKMMIDIINRDHASFSEINPSDFDLTRSFPISKFDAFDIETLALMPLMVQTGFLTFKDYDSDRNTFALGYPNWEVRQAFVRMLLDSRLHVPNTTDTTNMAFDIRDALKKRNMEDLIGYLNILIASIPGNLHTPKESYYHSLIHMIFQMSGLSIRSEEWVTGGRIDTVIEELDTFYIIEFKFGDKAQAAIDQIQQKNYAQKFKHNGKPIVAIGISVDCEQKMIGEWKIKSLALG